MKTIESLVLENLIYNEEYTRKVLPYINRDFFHTKTDGIIYDEIKNFFTIYNLPPTKEAIEISLNERKDLNGDEFKFIQEEMDSYSKAVESDKLQWLVDQTEKFCKDKAVYNAIMESIHIIDGKSTTKTENAIPSILSDALAISFDTHIGHDYLEDSDERYEFYHKVESKIAFDLEFMNLITKGGTPAKTLNIIMAGTGVGKSLFMCHHSAACLAQNKNVLYITCEMAEEKIAERIDANLMDITMDDLHALPYEMYQKKLKNATMGISGKLIIKEYPTATANANHFRILLEELKLKKQFSPDIIFIDYLNICASSRFKANANANSYTIIKSIAEELRGLAVEQNVPIFSATQVNRSGFTNSDFGLEDTSESFGLPATADFMIALIATEELDELNQVLVKQLKNRYNDTVVNRKFVLDINRAKMKLSDSKKGQQSLVDSNQTDETGYGSGFDGKNFDNKFKSKSLSDWTI